MSVIFPQMSINQEDLREKEMCMECIDKICEENVMLAVPSVKIKFTELRIKPACSHFYLTWSVPWHLRHNNPKVIANNFITAIACLGRPEAQSPNTDN